MKKRSRKIAEKLRASVVEPLRPVGVEVVFSEPLCRVSFAELSFKSLSAGGSIFLLECLEGFDIENGRLILANDYKVWQSLDLGVFMFKSALPNRPPFFAHKDKVISIRVLPSGRFLYPTS